MFEISYWINWLEKNNIIKKFFRSTLFVGVFLFAIFGLSVGQAKAQNLPTVNSNSVTKLLEVGGVYYYTFTSTTIDGDYHLYLTTSTNGVVGNWSNPVDVFNSPIRVVDFGNGHPNINFGFDYNSVGAYFGATIAASNTSQIWFTTSTNGSSWSSTSTAVSGLTADEINPILSFSSSENLATIFFKESNNQVNVVYSINNGGSWTSGTLFNTGDVYSVKGGKVSGSGTSRKFHIGLVKESSQHDVQYAYSINDASVWTTTTVDVIYGTVPIVGNFGFDRLVSFDVDGDGLPSFAYYKPVQVGGAGPYDVTSTIVYAHKSSLGSWSTSTLLSDVYFSIMDSSQQPSDLYFFNGNKPIFTGLGSNYGLVALVNTSSSWTDYNLTGGLIGTDSDVSSVYSSSTKNWASSFVLSDGSLKFVTTTLMTDAPTTTSIYPIQVYNPSIANISVTTTVSDIDGSNVNLLVEMSTDGSTWGTTSIYSASASTGTVTTSSGHIYGINTSAGQNNVSFVIGLLPGTGLDGYDGPAYVRITPYDVYYTGVPRVSGSFSVDLAQPTAPGNVSAYSVSTSSIVLNLPTTTSTDSNFYEYKIAYGTSGPDLFFTSSSDPNLANSNFNGAVTTTITGLSPSTTYTFQIYAYDAFGNATSSVGTFSTTTADYYSGQLPNVSSDAKTKLLLVNGKYYFAFSSSTSNGNYHLYVVSSTSGVNGTWSRPKDVFNFGIGTHRDYNTNSTIDGNFGFDYNSIGGYFGAAIYASGTSQIWFSTSTDGSLWGATSTIVSGLSTDLSARSIYIYFSKSENLAVVYYDVNSSTSSTIGVSYTTDNGVNWTPGNNLNLNLATLLDGQVSGSGLSRVFHFGYFDETLFDLVYASSTDNGVTWSTSTAATGVNGNILGVGDFGFYRAISFGLDDNGLPAFVFLKPVLAGGAGPYDVTSTLKYTHRNNSGIWEESNLDTIYWSIDSSVQRQTDLFFYNTNKPVFASMGTGFKLIGGSNDGSSWTTSTINSSVLNKYGDVSIVVNTSTNIWAAGYALNDGSLHFTTSSLSLVSNTAPSVTNISPSFSSDGNGLVTVTSTVSDADGNTVTLYVDYSLDGGTSWTSSTISTFSGSGTFTTSSGAIAGIGSTLSGNAISFVWNSQLAGATSTSDAQIRIRPNDGTVNGTTKTSASFIIDNVAPTAPSISASTVTVSSVTIQWGAVSGASFYTVSSTAGSTVTTTEVSKSFSGLSASTNYAFQVKATDAYGNASSFSSVYSVSTSANTTVSSGGGGSSPAPSAPSSPAIFAPAIINQEFAVTGSVEVKVGNVVHKVKVNKIDLINNQANFTVESTPITFTLKVNEEKTLDTDGDKITDVRVKLNSINSENKTVNLAIISVADLQFTINHFDLTTASRDVILYFNSPDAKTMAVSDSEDFKSASFETYAKTKKWKLSAGDGYKKIYVKFRTAQGGVKVIASEIKLVSTNKATEKTIIPETPSETLVPTGYVFKRNLSAGSSGSDIKQLQIVLKQLGYYTYPKLTNTYGPYTKEAVKKFQKANKIKPVNGQVGPVTRKALNSLE